MVDFGSQVVLLDPPVQEHNDPVRTTMLMVCPLCGLDYELGTSQLLYCVYNDIRTGVGVCPSCADHPPMRYQSSLVNALDIYEWSEPREVRIDHAA